MSDETSREFLYVLIPEGLSPLDRGDKYEDTLDDRLGAFGLGEVTGGGSQLGPAPDLPSSQSTSSWRRRREHAVLVEHPDQRTCEGLGALRLKHDAAEMRALQSRALDHSIAGLDPLTAAQCCGQGRSCARPRRGEVQHARQVGLCERMHPAGRIDGPDRGPDLTVDDRHRQVVTMAIAQPIPEPHATAERWSDRERNADDERIGSP